MKEVSNPAPAEGGADPNRVTPHARLHLRPCAHSDAPSRSTDFETIATASGEAAKASATWVWRTLQKAVHLTVAAQEGAMLSVEALARLHASLDTARDPNHQLLLDNFSRAPITVSATLIVDATYVREDVLAAARQALVDFFDFDTLALAHPIHRSDMYAVLQEVPGVTALDLDVFHFKGYASWTAQELAVRGATADPLQPHLRIFGARRRVTRFSSHDRVLKASLAGAAAPPVLPAEQAWLEDPAADLTLSATGGIG